MCRRVSGRGGEGQRERKGEKERASERERERGGEIEKDRDDKRLRQRERERETEGDTEKERESTNEEGSKIMCILLFGEREEGERTWDPREVRGKRICIVLEIKFKHKIQHVKETF